MIWAVVDTAVWVQGFGRPASPAGIVVNRFLEGDFLAVASGPLLEELYEVLRLPRFASIFPDAAGLAGLVALSIGHVVADLKREAPVDGPANPAAQAASATQADFIVTGDEVLLDVAIVDTANVVIADHFLEVLEAESKPWTQLVVPANRSHADSKA